MHVDKQPKHYELARYVLLKHGQAHVAELPNVNGTGMVYGIIDGAKTVNAELSDLHPSSYEAWMDAAKRLGWTTEPHPAPEIPKALVSDDDVKHWAELRGANHSITVGFAIELQQWRAWAKGGKNG